MIFIEEKIIHYRKLWHTEKASIIILKIAMLLEIIYQVIEKL